MEHFSIGDFKEFFDDGEGVDGYGTGGDMRFNLTQLNVCKGKGAVPGRRRRGAHTKAIEPVGG